MFDPIQVGSDLYLLFPGWDSVQGSVLETPRGPELRVLLTVGMTKLHAQRREKHEIYNQLAQRPWPKRFNGVRFKGRLVGKR